MSIGTFQDALKSLKEVANSEDEGNAIFGRLMCEILPVLQTGIETELKRHEQRGHYQNNALNCLRTAVFPLAYLC